MVVDYKAYADGRLFEDTTARGKPIVFLYGKRPFSGGMCLGVEQALATMRAGARAAACSRALVLLAPAVLRAERASSSGDARQTCSHPELTARPSLPMRILQAVLLASQPYLKCLLRFICTTL